MCKSRKTNYENFLKQKYKLQFIIVIKEIFVIVDILNSMSNPLWFIIHQLLSSYTNITETPLDFICTKNNY